MISFVNTKKAAGTGGNSQEAPALIALSDLGTGLTTFYDLFRDVPEMNEPSNFQLSPFTFQLSTAATITAKQVRYHSVPVTIIALLIGRPSRLAN